MGSHENAIGQAAIRVLADKGGRGFTHRAVDEEAGVSEGTTSRYARSRDALFVLAADALFAADMAAAGAPDGMTGLDDAVQTLVAATTALLAAPQRYKARVELQLEAVRSAALQEHFQSSRTVFTTALADGLRALKVPDAKRHADILVAMVDGVLHRHIVLGESALNRRALDYLFRAYLAPLMA